MLTTPTSASFIPATGTIAIQSLSFTQKTKILDEYNKRKVRGTKPTESALAGWAKEELGLAMVPIQYTISWIICELCKIKSLPVSQNVNKKKKQTVAAIRLEDVLLTWVFTQNNRGVMVNSELRRMEATRMMNEAKKLLVQEEQLSLKFSKGWIERSKKRYGMRFRRVYGEAISVDNDAIAHHMPRIERTMMTFSARDTWNAEEFGLVYRQPSNWTI